MKTYKAQNPTTLQYRDTDWSIHELLAIELQTQTEDKSVN